MGFMRGNDFLSYPHQAQTLK